MTNEEKVLKVKCENSLLFYARYIYKEVHGRNFAISPHFIEVANTLERVYNGEITRLIINIPPRYGKTELAIKIFVSWCIAKANSSKFIHLSYSDALALDNSAQTKEYIQSNSFQRLWGMDLKRDAQSKGKWFNEFGGGMYATASGGAITGFGAGSTTINEGFGGAIIIDDPLKPDDAFSEVKRKTVNERYNNTIRSRVNSRETPIILIMQRLHEEDLSGFLLDGGSGEKWEHLCLPALDTDNKPLWEQKHTFNELEQIRQANRYTFAGQYMQTPAPDEGGEWRKEWFEIVDLNTLPSNLRWTLLIDGAYTKNTKNDPTGLQIGTKHNGNYYILSSIDKYMELPELVKFIPQHIIASGVNVSMSKVEPKASGKSIAQLIRNQTRLNISEIKTPFVNSSKIENARMSSPYIEGGRVKLIRGNWNAHFLNQVGTFPNAKHDEHVDLTCYGIEDTFMNNSRIEIR
tara:strand:+ start:4148 stop:5533 length:1386 start_codon:yes stop_codon:yes gene_type:complete